MGMVDGISGAVGGKVLLGEEGKYQPVGSEGRIRGVSVSTFIHFLFEVMESIEQVGFQLFLKLNSVLLYTNLQW